MGRSATGQKQREAKNQKSHVESQGNSQPRVTRQVLQGKVPV
jgi:hypothetical protein